MVSISITPEIALDEYPVFAGGLGILEGDKFNAAADAGLNYIAITFLYRKGYADYERFDGNYYNLKEIARNVEGILTSEPNIKVNLGSEIGDIEVVPWILKKGSAKAVFMEPISPESAVRATRSLYSQDTFEDEMLKYSILAKASVKYINERVDTGSIEHIDLQESLSSLPVLMLSDQLLQKTRLITHTPGPWGHREFSVDFLDKVFGEGSVEKTLGYRPENGYVMLTEMALNSVSKAYTVSKKAEDIILRWERLAKYRSKIDFVTNGVDLARWTHPAIAELMAKNETVDSVDFAAAHKNAKRDLISLIKHYKPEIKLSDENMIVSWNRRPANYKRPYFAMDLIEDLGENSNVVFVLAGKAHPKSEKELEFMRRFGETAKRHNNVVYMHDYDIPKAKSILSGSDLVLFTPFSGWEACGTSFMKAGINGVPTLASKDGGAAELIKNGVNGWFFGNDIKECMVIDDGSEAVMQINRADYSEMKSVFFSAMETFYKEPEKYREIMLNTLSSFRENADVAKSLLKYDISPNAVEKYRRIKRAADHTNKEKERSV